MSQRSQPKTILRFWLLLVAFCGLGLGVLAGRVAPAAVNLPADYRPANYIVREAFPGLPSLRPVVITSPPGDTNRIFFADQRGIIYVMTNRAAPSLTTFLDLRDRVWQGYNEAGLLGLAFHPGWQTNRQFFVFYTGLVQDTNGAYSLLDRLVRLWIDPADPNRALPEPEQALISQADENFVHNAGDLHFGLDNNLYVSLGDEGGGYDQYFNTHHLDGDFFSAILRLDVDRRPGSLPPNPHPAVNPGTYAVPADNPFVGATNYVLGGTNVILPVLDPTKVRTEFFAIGFRNPFRFGIDPVYGEIYGNDVGQETREEINHIVSGGDYGWVWREGFMDWPFGVPGGGVGLIDPLADYAHTNTLRAITGGLLYRGKAYPELDGAWVFSDVNGAIGMIQPKLPPPVSIQWLAFEPGISALGKDPVTGEILIANVFAGKINRLVRTGAPVITALGEWPAPPPRKLSQTAVFKNLVTLTPADGVVPYDINSPFWSDYAIKRRWFRLPSAEATFGFRTNGAWDAPAGSLFVKHFDLPTNRQDSASTRRLETRLVTRTTNGVYAVTYRWDADGKDATLVPPEGATEEIPVFDSGVIKTQIWRYPGNFECLLCHNSSAGYILGFRTDQLSHLTSGPTGITNQLQRMIAAGCVAGAPTAVNVLPRLAAVADESSSRDWRVRSYLSANCSQCHQPTGPSWASWDARWQTPLEESGEIFSAIVLGADVVFPGDVSKSAIYDRLTVQGPYGHMPPLGTFELNPAAINLVSNWITSDLPARVPYGSWLTNYFPNVNGVSAPAAAPEADPDGDGLSNQAEYLLGESPLNPVVGWRPQILADAHGAVRIRFLRKANRCFTVESLTDLKNPQWQPVDIPENAPFYGAADEWVELPLPTGPAAGFFRVAITPVP